MQMLLITVMVGSTSLKCCDCSVRPDSNSTLDFLSCNAGADRLRQEARILANSNITQDLHSISLLLGQLHSLDFTPALACTGDDVSSLDQAASFGLPPIHPVVTTKSVTS